MRQHYRHTNVGRPRRSPSPQWADRLPCPVLWAPGQGPARSAIASSSTAAALTVEHEDVGNSRGLQKIRRARICRQDPEMNGDYVAVRTTVYNARTYRDVRHTDRTDNRALPIRHKHIHARGGYRPIYSFQIHIRNFNAKGMQLRTGTCLAKRKPREPAVEIAAHRNKSGQPVLLGECAGAALKRDQKPDQQVQDGQPGCAGQRSIPDTVLGRKRACQGDSGTPSRQLEADPLSPSQPRRTSFEARRIDHVKSTKS